MPREAVQDSMNEGQYMPTGKHLRVLIVEDNAITSRILARMLRDHYSADVAFTFDEALAMADEVHYDLFVLDIDLGERRTGVEVMHALREEPAYRKAAFVACTAYAVPGLRERFLEVGFDAYISKPFTKQGLLDTCEEALSGQSAPAEPVRFEQGVQLKLPPLSPTVPEIMQLMREEQAMPDIGKLRGILATDPITSAWVLRRVNTAYYSLQHKISDIDKAVIYLGFTPVCNLVLAEVLSQTFVGLDTTEAQRVYRHVLKTSLATAAFARHLAYHLDLPKPEIVFTGGIFSQLGRLALLGHDPDGYAQLWFPDGADVESSVPQPPPIGLELIRYEYDHVSLGVRIAEQWGMPKDITTIIRHYQDLPVLKPEALYHRVLAVAAGRCAAEELLTSKRARTPCRALTRLADELASSPERLRRFLIGKEEDVRGFLETIEI